VGSSAKWVAVLLFVTAAIFVIALTAYDGSCEETPYGGSRLVQCETVEVFLPGPDEAKPNAKEASINVLALLPTRVIAFFAAMGHGHCKTTQIDDGKWTVCDDGFSLLERETPLVATALRSKPTEDAVAQAERKAAEGREKVDLPVEDSDCGRYLCSEYLEGERDPKREAYRRSLTDRELARLHARSRAWRRQEVMRGLEEARASNTALHERLAEIAAHEAQLATAEEDNRRRQETLAHLQPDRGRHVESSE